MTIKVACPACGKILNAPDASAGKKGKCSCGNVCVIPATVAVVQKPVQVSVKPAPSDVLEREPTGDFVIDSAAMLKETAGDAAQAVGSGSLVVGKAAGKGGLVAIKATGSVAMAALSMIGRAMSKPTATTVEDPSARAPTPPQGAPPVQYAPPPAWYYQQPQQPVTVVVNQSNSNVNTAIANGGRARPGNGAATVALVLALLALAFSWIPLLGLFCIPLALLAIVVAGLGFLLGLMRSGSGIVGSFLAGCIAVGAIMLSMGSTAALLAVPAAGNSTPTNTGVSLDPVPADSSTDQPESGSAPASSPDR